MTIINSEHERVTFPPQPPADFWRRLHTHLDDHPSRWTHLAMLCLQVHSGWSLEQIGQAFGQSKGHVSRSVHAVKRALRSRLERPARGFSDPEAVAAGASENLWPLAED
jgi:DNA-directed RNA polymerase specialized sigma24 family protein